MKYRAVVTGLGVVSPVGNSLPEFWKSICEGKCGISRIERFDVSSDEYSVKIAGEVKDFDPRKRISDPKILKRRDRFTVYALYSAMEAIEDSGLDLETLKKERVGVIVASGIGGVETWEQQHKRLLNLGPSRVSPFFIPMLIINTACLCLIRPCNW